MNAFNKIISLASVLALLLTFSRLSLVSKVSIPPFGFLRVQEVVNLIIVCFGSVLLSFFIFKLSLNEKLLNRKVFGVISTLYFFGVFMYISGFAIHEFANYWYLKWCGTLTVEFCNVLSFTDETFSHIIFFIGFGLISLSLVWLEFISSNKLLFNKNQKIILVANSFLFGLGLFLNSAFESAFMDMVFSFIVLSIISLIIFITKRKISEAPLTYYLIFGFIFGFTSTLIYKFIVGWLVFG